MTPYGPKPSPTVGSYGVAVSYKRGSPVAMARPGRRRKWAHGPAGRTRGAGDSPPPPRAALAGHPAKESPPRIRFPGARHAHIRVGHTHAFVLDTAAAELDTHASVSGTLQGLSSAGRTRGAGDSPPPPRAALAGCPAQKRPRYDSKLVRSHEERRCSQL